MKEELLISPCAHQPISPWAIVQFSPVNEVTPFVTPWAFWIPLVACKLLVLMLE